MPSMAELVCVDPNRVREIWLYGSPLLKAACQRIKLNAFADIEADILAGRSLLWIAWDSRTIQAAAATILINTEIGKACIITVCGGGDMRRWLPCRRFQSFKMSVARVAVKGRPRRGLSVVAKQPLATASAQRSKSEGIVRRSVELGRLFRGSPIRVIN